MAHKPIATERPALDLSQWRNVPRNLLVAGGVLSVLGWIVGAQGVCVFLAAGVHVLPEPVPGRLVSGDGASSVSMPVGRFPSAGFANTSPACSFPGWPSLFIPVALMAKTIYTWMSVNPARDHALAAKQPLFTVPMFYLTSALCFAVWWLLSNRLRYWSLEQDKTGDAKPTYRMRVYSGVGIVLYALSLTLGVIMWVKSLQYQWFSTMYGVYYFAGSVWMTLATVYVITMILDRLGVLTEVLHEHQYYFIGSLLFAFTVFYAYIHFAQYFIIWNGNMPEETFWYVVREKGTWWWIGMVIIFGHFFVPFLALLRIDVKNVFKFMVPLCVWAWLMHWVDLSFNIMPVPHPDGFPLKWIWLHFGCWACLAGGLTIVFLKKYAAHAPYPIKDPRLIEAMGLYHPVPTQISGGELGETDELRDAPPQFRGGLQ